MINGIALTNRSTVYASLLEVTWPEVKAVIVTLSLLCNIGERETRKPPFGNPISSKTHVSKRF